MDFAPPVWPRWPRWLLILYAVGVLSATGSAAYLSGVDDQTGRPSLAFLSPAIDWLIAVWQPLRSDHVPGFLTLILSGALLCLYAVARFTELPGGEPRRSPRRLSHGWNVLAEVVSLSLLTLTTVVYRFYALNQLPSSVETELFFHVLASSDWESLLAVNGHAAPGAPSAPLGLGYYLLNGASLQAFGVNVLAVRIVSAVTSVLLVQMLYWLVRTVAGPLAAVIAAVFCTVAPVEMVWGRYEMVPYSYPSPVLLALSLSTYFAVSKFRLRYWMLTVLLMGVSYHLFPSGLCGFLIPIGVLLWLACFDRGRLRTCGWKPWLVLAGVLLWAGGRSVEQYLGSGMWKWLSPLNPGLMASRGLRTAGWSYDAWWSVVENIQYLFYRLYVGLPGSSHQTPITTFFGSPGTYIPPLVAILFTAGLVQMLCNRRRVTSAVMLSLLAASVLPGIVSTAAAHRMAVVFPAIAGVAGIAAASGLRFLQSDLRTFGTAIKVALPVLVLPAMLLQAGAAYFDHRMGEPIDVALGRALRRHLEAGTLMVVDLPHGLFGPTVFQLFDDLREGPVAFTLSRAPNWPAIAENPQPTFDENYYQYTVLRERVASLRNAQWKRIVYILHEKNDARSKLALLRSLYPGLGVTEEKPIAGDSWGALHHRFTVVAVSLD